MDLTNHLYRTDGKRGITKSLCAGMAMAMLAAGTPCVQMFATSPEAMTQTQGRKVQGKVVDQTGEPLIGVSIQVKGTQQGAVTDMDGNFSLDAAPGATLVVSYIGYQTQTLKASSTMNITMQDDSQSLDELVVIGYGTMKKKLVTGATTQVKGDDILKKNTTSPLQALQGQTPGVNITSTSGQPGSDMKVVIRGLGTVGNADPLYLIDGVGGDISTVNPADIERIDILKDAASAAIYGAQAANGVVLVTTKHGSEGRTRINLDGYIGWQSVGRKVDLLNRDEYKAIMNEASLNSGNGAIDWTKYTTNYDANGNMYDSDWMNEMLHDNALTRSVNLGITGGGKKSTYALSFGYMDQEGVVGGSEVSDYKRYNFRINSDHQINKAVRIGEQLGVVYKNNHGVSVGDQYNNSLRGAFAAAPIVPIYGDNNIYGVPYYDTTNDSWWKEQGNPYGLMMVNNNSDNRNVTLTGNIYLEWEIIKNLKYKSTLGTVYSTSESRTYKPYYHFSSYTYNDNMDQATQSMGHGLGMTWTNTVSYDWTVKDNHMFNALLGMESYRYEGTSLYAANGMLKNNDWMHAYVTNGTGSSTDEGLTATGAPHDKSRSVSYFARFGWNYKETYMFNATLRADGSSRFASGHRFGWFPSFSAGWTISNEKFMQNTKSWLDYLKLRASWGQVGNQNISNYQYLAPITTSNTHYKFGTGMGATAQSANWGAYPSRLANYDVTWETSQQTNVGIDARFLDSRLGVNFDLYWKSTKDWLVVAPILDTAGTGAPYINGGDVKNRGYEFAVTWDDHINKDLRYHLGANIAYNHNEVGNIPNEDGIIHGKTNMLYDNSDEFYRAQNGHPIGYFWGYKTAGIFQNKQEIADWISAGNGIKQKDVQPGDVKYIDVNHDCVIDENDKVDLGNGMPKFSFGFNIALYWKKLDFSITASGAAGYKIVQTYRNHANTKANYTTEILSRWTGEGTSNKIPRVTENNINWDFSDLYLHDGDYLRISDVTVGYDFSDIIKCKFVNQLRLYFQVQNLFTFTKYNGMDPEIGYGTDSWVSGVDVGYYPRPRTFLFGLNVKF